MNTDEKMYSWVIIWFWNLASHIYMANNEFYNSYQRKYLQVLKTFFAFSSVCTFFPLLLLLHILIFCGTWLSCLTTRTKKKIHWHLLSKGKSACIDKTFMFCIELGKVKTFVSFLCVCVPLKRVPFIFCPRDQTGFFWKSVQRERNSHLRHPKKCHLKKCPNWKNSCLFIFWWQLYYYWFFFIFCLGKDVAKMIRT